MRLYIVQQFIISLKTLRRQAYFCQKCLFISCSIQMLLSYTKLYDIPRFSGQQDTSPQLENPAMACACKVKNFDVILGHVVPFRKFRWICRKHLNDIARQVETSIKSTYFIARHDFLVAWRLHYTMTVKHVDTCSRDIFSLTAWELHCDMHVASCCVAFARYIFIKHLFHENLCPITF